MRIKNSLNLNNNQENYLKITSWKGLWQRTNQQINNKFAYTFKNWLKKYWTCFKKSKRLDILELSVLKFFFISELFYSEFLRSYISWVLWQSCFVKTNIITSQRWCFKEYICIQTCSFLGSNPILLRAHTYVYNICIHMYTIWIQFLFFYEQHTYSSLFAMKKVVDFSFLI